jgi:hypothetical protein
MPSQHIWTEKDQHGRKREVRATKFGGAWRFQSKIAGEAEWTYYNSPPLPDLLSLKEIVGRKYRRRRASIEDVASVEKLIADQTMVGTPRCPERFRGSTPRANPGQ